MGFVHAILALIPISSIISAMVIWFSQRKIEKKIEVSEQREKSREEMQLLLIRTVNAATAVSEALALAYQSSTDAPISEELRDALDVLHTVKVEQERFFQKQTVQHLNRGGDS
mgnify:CR=1 FL=1|jgi:hypothetical protein